MTRSNDTPFDPNMVARHIVTGAIPPDVPFVPPRHQAEPFEVKDEATANWVVRKIVEARNYGARVADYAEREMRRAQREEAFFVEHYGPQLERWARAQLAATKAHRKQLRLPAGAIGFRKVGDKIEVADESKLLAWCKAHLPAAVGVVERVIKAAVREHVQNTGECPDGATVQNGGERFYIT